MKNLEYWKLQLQYVSIEKAKLSNQIQENINRAIKGKVSKPCRKELHCKNLKLAHKINQIDTTKIPYFNSMIEKLNKSMIEKLNKDS